MNLVSILSTPSAKRTNLLLKAIEGSNAMQRKLVERADKKHKKNLKKKRS